MANMSYCRFTNTANDLRDCVEQMDDPEALSKEEAAARLRIIRMAVQIAGEFGHEVQA